MAIRVLIADRDPVSLASYQTQLSKDGFEVSTATNGFDCLDKLHALRPRVLVLEPEIPWGDGVLIVMHRVCEQPLVPVFIITSHKTFARINLNQFPLITHLQTKPVPPDQLVRLLRHIVDEPRPFLHDLRFRSAPCDIKTKRRRSRTGRTTYLEATEATV